MNTPPRDGRLISQRYKLDEVIGRGAMGAVWRAEDTTLRRAVAVKEVVLPPGLSKEDRAVACERTLREARAIARLAHPNVVTLYDVLDEDQRPWVVMELVLARSLAGLLKEEGPVDYLRAARIGLAVLSALQAAHEVGIVHRDVKPGNILIGDDGLVKLTDFGIARAAGDMTLTGTGLLVGSPSYMAPEVIRGEDTGPAADLFGLGATLYCAVEGRPPFGGGDAMATLSSVVSDPPTPYKKAGPLRPALDGLLEKDPRRRLSPAQARHLLLQVLRDQDQVGLGAPMTLNTEPAPGHDPRAGWRAATRPPPQLAPPAPVRHQSHGSHGGVDSPTSVSHGAPQWGGAQPAYGGRQDGGMLPGMGGGGHYPPNRGQQFGGQRPPRSAKSTATVLVAAGLAIAVVIGSIAIGRSFFGSDNDRGGPTTGQGSEPTPDGGGVEPGQTPAGYTKYEDQSAGFSAAVPEGWTRNEPSPTATDFNQQDAKIRFYVFGGASGGPDANFGEQSFRTDSKYADYKRLRMEQVQYREYDAVEWEFTFRFAEEDVLRHVLWRGFIVDGTLFGIYVSAPDSAFAESKKHFETAIETFQTTT